MRLLSRARRRRDGSPAPRAERFLVAGAEQSRLFGHDHVGTEHVLLALAANAGDPAARALARLGIGEEVVRRDIERLLGTCVDPRRPAIDPDALATLGIDLDEVTRRVEEAFGPGALAGGGPWAQTGLTCKSIAPRLKKALELAAAEAGDGPVRDAHVLVSLAAVEHCLAARILADHGVSEAALREALARMA